jgi:hypothetical protein
MIAIDETLVSDLLFEKKFVCDLNACKGHCCVAGDSGAPLEKEEIAKLKNNYKYYKKYMRPQGIAEIEKQGFAVIDYDNEYTTPLIDTNKECAFVYFDENNIAKCAVEKAYLNNESKFRKPISCHLYPIRLSKINNMVALNYDTWDVCKPACTCGEKLNVPVFKFLKDSITRRFGKRYFNKMEIAFKLFSEK